MIAVIDYGAGNLHSVKNALDYLGAKSIVTNDKNAILSADKVILPGVGAFGDAMDCIRQSGLRTVITDAMNSGKPFLGVCLGLHLLFDSSEESPDSEGLGFFSGKTVRIPQVNEIKIPHMGWNSLDYNRESRLFYKIGSEPFVYFVHSYYVVPEDEGIISARTVYGSELAVAVEKKNVYAVQFHPEKSGRTGLRILTNFIKEI